MAYKKLIVWRCDWNGCPQKAMFEVVNARNSSVGRYCNGHANFTLKELKKLEAQNVEKER